MHSRLKAIFTILSNNIPLILLGIVSLICLSLLTALIAFNSEGNNIRVLQYNNEGTSNDI